MVKDVTPDGPAGYIGHPLGKDKIVNPPTSFSSADTATGAAALQRVDVVGFDAADSPCHLTFDEMRELPMHLALGFDLEGDNS